MTEISVALLLFACVSIMKSTVSVYVNVCVCVYIVRVCVKRAPCVLVYACVSVCVFVYILLLRSKTGMVMSDLEVDVLNVLGSSLKFLLGCPQLVP